MEQGTIVSAYYQTLGSLKYDFHSYFTHYFLAAIHFGTNQDGSPYMHLNDHDIDDPVFDEPMTQLQQLREQNGATICLMVGGAGSAFQQLFSNFETYYGMLKSALEARPWISGIDLDVEETVPMEKIQMLIDRLDADFGSSFLITMAPLAGSLASNEPGMGGFVYRDLLETTQGKRINWFNGQFYGGSFTHAMVDSIVENGVSSSKIVMGMLASDFPSFEELTKACAQVRKAKLKHPNLKGVFVWEHDLAKPGPVIWSDFVNIALNWSTPERVKNAILNRPKKRAAKANADTGTAVEIVFDPHIEKNLGPVSEAGITTSVGTSVGTGVGTSVGTSVGTNHRTDSENIIDVKNSRVCAVL